MKRILAVGFVLAVGAAAAQDYPARPIHLLTPAAQGGTTDFLARLFGARLSDALKQPVIVENRASASGVLAGEITAKAPPDGYTLLLAYHQHTVNAALNPDLPYHAVNSFTPITQLTSGGFILLVNASSPPRNLQQFIEWTRSTPNLNFGSAGIGTGGHLAGELYKLLAGVKAEHIPYKGSGPAITALLGSEFHFIFSAVQPAGGAMRGGRVIGLAVTTPKRLAAHPDLPAVAEALPGYEVVGWYGVLGPANLPKPIVARLHDLLVASLQVPEVRQRIEADGSEVVGSAPEEFREFMLRDVAKWAKVVKESGAKLN